jgi:hypothetical protein
MLDSGTESFGVGAAGSTVVRLTLLGKRCGREACESNGNEQGDMAYHWLASIQHIARSFFLTDVCVMRAARAESRTRPTPSPGVHHVVILFETAARRNPFQKLMRRNDGMASLVARGRPQGFTEKKSSGPMTIRRGLGLAALVTFVFLISWWASSGYPPVSGLCKEARRVTPFRGPFSSACHRLFSIKSIGQRPHDE